jgi:putative membrane protein
MKLLRRSATAAVAVVGALALAASPAAAAPSEQDTAWMVAAHQSNLAEIAAGTSAQENATTDDVRELGAMFVEMHTALDADLTAAATQLGVTLPDAPTPDQQAQLAAVEQNSGRAYDTAWIAQQIGSHTATLAATRTEIAEGSDQTVVALAQASAPVVEQHLAELRSAADEYGVPSAVPGGTGGQAADSSARTTGLGLAALGAVLCVGAALVLVRRRG